LPTTVADGGLSRTTAALKQIGTGVRDNLWRDCPGCAKCRDTGGYVLRKGSWRPTRAHEYIFQFTKTADYYADREAVKEDHHPDGRKATAAPVGLDTPYAAAHNHERWPGSGRNPRDCLWIQPGGNSDVSGKHFAMFPPKLPEFCIKASTSEVGVCPKCGAPWSRVLGKGERRVTDAMRIAGCDSSGEYHGSAQGDYAGGQAQDPSESKRRMLESMAVPNLTLGWRPTCGCWPFGGLRLDDLETIGSPTGRRTSCDPSKVTGRAGWNRPRGDNEGIDTMTRYEQRQYAEQLRVSSHRREMEAEVGKTAFDHYKRTDRSGARPIPRSILTCWLERGWLTVVSLPNANIDLSQADWLALVPPEFAPVPATVLDPFSGLATTGVVALQLGRAYIGIELNVKYAEQSRQRLAEATRQGRLL